MTGNLKWLCGSGIFTIIHEKWVQLLISKNAEKQIQILHDKYKDKQK